jgi:hypothetical protein
VFEDLEDFADHLECGNRSSPLAGSAAWATINAVLITAAKRSVRIAFTSDCVSENFSLVPARVAWGIPSWDSSEQKCCQIRQIGARAVSHLRTGERFGSI